MRPPILLLVSALSLMPLVACGSSTPEAGGRRPEGIDSSRASAEPRAGGGSPTKATRRDDTPRVVMLGDSLTAGLGLSTEQSFPSLIQARLDREGYEYEVVNAGVSGDTSAGGLRRLQWALDGHPVVLVVALGANDGLRGLPVRELKRNLSTIIEDAQARGLTVILAGMEAPPNNGPEYTAAFRKVYSDLAKDQGVRLIPFLLQGVAGDTSLNQADGIHPNARGAQIVADLVWAALAPALTRTGRDTR